MDKRDIDRLHFLGGQVQALMSFAFAVIESHPEPATLRVAFDLNAEPAIAQATPSPVKDQYLEGLKDATSRVRVALAKAEELRSAGA